MKRPISDVVSLEELSAPRSRIDARLSEKVRQKLEKLDEWRVDASQLKLAADGPRVEGGFAVVCRASLIPSADEVIFEQTDSDVAVKMMKIKDGDDIAQVLRRAIREADLISDLDHENIIALEGFVEDVASGRIWLLFPWAEMGNVRDFVASENWSIPERIWLINDVSRGVYYLHSQEPPICHGDLKSINILVNSEFRAIITDFGSARRVKTLSDEREPEPTPVQRDTSNEKTLSVEFCQNSNTITFTGTEYTLRWVAPELLGEEDAGTPADIWSMGWVFYEIMTGSIPFEHLQKDAAIIRHIMKGELPPLKDHDRMSLILELVSVMAKCWEISPERRPSADRCRKYVSQMPMCAPHGKQSHRTALEIADSLFEEGEMHILQDNYDEALAVFTNALTVLGDEAKSSEGGSRILWRIAEIHRIRNEYDKATVLYRKVAQIGEDTGNRTLENDAKLGLARIHRLGDEYDEDALYREALQICKDEHDRGGEADALRGLAEGHRVRKEYGEAAALYNEVLQILEDVEDERRKAHTWLGLAWVHRARKEYAKSLQLFMKASELYQAFGVKYGLAHTLEGLASVYYDQERFEDATKFYEEAAELFAEMALVEYASDARESATDARQKGTGLLEIENNG